MGTDRDRLIRYATEKLISRSSITNKEMDLLGIPSRAKGWKKRAIKSNPFRNLDSETIIKYIHGDFHKKENKKPKEENKRRYHKYLKSDQWKMMAVGIKQIRGNKCEKCGSGNNLQVHHKHYMNIYKEKLKDLLVLCGGCHKKEHGL